MKGIVLAFIALACVLMMAPGAAAAPPLAHVDAQRCEPWSPSPYSLSVTVYALGPAGEIWAPCWD